MLPAQPNRFLDNATVLSETHGNERKRNKDKDRAKLSARKKKPLIKESNSPEKPSDKELYLARTFKQLMGSLDTNTQILQRTIDALRKLPDSKQVSHSHLPALSQEHKTVTSREKMIVEVKVNFMKIKDIDTVIQQFEAEILVRAKWQEPLLSGLTNTEFDPHTMWYPNLLVMNLDGDFSVNKSVFKVIHNAPGYKDPLVVWMWRFKGSFQENLELQHFPVDVQDLTISLTSERSEDEIDLIEDQSCLSTVNTKTFMDAQEWDIYEHVETFEGKTTLEYASENTHPIFHAQCRVKRKIGYFLWNIIFIVGLITILTFTTFSIEPNSADRLGVAITLLLTSVTFKLIVKQSLPTISYLTYLDLYVLAALMFLGLTSSQHAVIKYLAFSHSADQVNLFDLYSVSCLIVVFISFHLIFGVYIYLTAIRKREKMDEKDRIYKSKRQYLEIYGESTNTEKAIQMSMSKMKKIDQAKI